VAYQLTFGPLAEGRDLLHACDNPPCCNPAHLRPGTHLDNMLDMRRKGRAVDTPSPGERNGQAKLTEDQVLAIRRSNLKLKELAAIYGVHFSTIHLIKSRKKWKHI